MKITDKELNQTKLTIQLDSKEHKRFFNKVFKIAKEVEYKSNTKKLEYSIIVNSIKTPYMNCRGWTSRTQDMKHVLFLDWDNILFWIVEEQLKYLIEKYNLPPFYVFKTEERKDCNGDLYGNYIAINLKKDTFMNISNMQDELACDAAHKRLPLLYRFHSWVLRTSPKGKKDRPQFKCIVGDINELYEQDVSNAHLETLRGMYPNIPIIRYLNLDKSKKLWSAEYKTASG